LQKVRTTQPNPSRRRHDRAENVAGAQCSTLAIEAAELMAFGEDRNAEVRCSWRRRARAVRRARVRIATRRVRLPEAARFRPERRVRKGRLMPRDCAR
jgi:hypothetical protein